MVTVYVCDLADTLVGDNVILSSFSKKVFHELLHQGLQLIQIMNKRRDNVPFDPYYFEKLTYLGVNLLPDDTFRQIFQTNHWRGANSISGEGASRRQTQQIEAQLLALLKTLQVEILLDLPCGDLSWMQFIDLPISNYIGADIVPELITENQKRYGSKKCQFLTLNLINDPLPRANILLCRDCFVHLSIADIFLALDNIKSSHIDYLLTTTFLNCEDNEDIIPLLSLSGISK
ncbi:MAG: class I SAM-dependent methyltransferase [Nostoc sp.]|uniref:class I SAM-dependent methyltransferase n=1 Tax=Nostoc sp. TaxID=1180 RepID=UPI002FFA5E4D